MDGLSNSVATTQVSRFVSLSYQDTRRLYSRKNGKLESLTSTIDKSDDDQNGEKKFCICKETYDENRPMVG